MTPTRGSLRAEPHPPGPPAGPTPLRRRQLAELDILRDFARACAAQHLRWFVIGGTLLGAARHRGFIPWDDDVDVGMPRPDYERFRAWRGTSSDARFAWASTETTRDHPFMYGKLWVGDTETFVDVFPIDGAPGSRLARAGHALAFKVAVTALGARIPRRGARRYAAVPLRLVPRRVALAAIGLLAERFAFDASPFAVNASGAWGYGRECQPRSRFVPVGSLEFEGLSVPTPGRWHAYLTQIYGDYRREPPPGARRSRHGDVA